MPTRSAMISASCAWLREWLLPHHGGVLLIAIASGIVALALAMALNVPAMLLTIAVLVIGQAALIFFRAGNGRLATWAEGLAVIGLPFALGLLALARASWQIGLVCVVMGAALMAARAGAMKLMHAGSVLTIATFMLLREPAAAFAVSVVWATVALLRPTGSRLGLVLLCLAGVAISLVL